jgi:hypothetical protein
MTREEGEAIKSRWERGLLSLTDRHYLAEGIGIKTLLKALAAEDDLLLDKLPSVQQIGVPAR